MANGGPGGGRGGVGSTGGKMAGAAAGGAIAGAAIAGAVIAARGRKNKPPGRLAKMLPPEATLPEQPEVADGGTDVAKPVAIGGAATLGAAAVGAGGAAGDPTSGGRDSRKVDDKQQLLQNLYDDLEEDISRESPRFRPKISLPTAMFLAQVSSC